tara:strand:+ start:574 stop:1020 length:447 start_codon:yes stop_codon:yes gene_type:complete
LVADIHRNYVFFFVEILEPINCILISEEVPSVSIVLTERRSDALKGYFSIGNKFKGNFYTHRPTSEKSTRWTFEKSKIKFTGEAILFRDGRIWHPYQNEIKSNEVNRVLFYGLSSKLSNVTDKKDLLKAASGFFTIGNQCYGGRIKKV